MKLKKGTINNINKKLLSGIFVFTILTTQITGCTEPITIDDIKYSKDNQGNVLSFDAPVSYEILKLCSFYKFVDTTTNSEYYTIVLLSDPHIKYDIFTGEIINNEGMDCFYLGDFVPVATSYNMIKDEYSEQELKEMLNKIKEAQNEYEKQLVKGK